MADIRPKDLLPTAAMPAADDYLLLDGATEGTRKMLGSLVTSYEPAGAGAVERTIASKLADVVSLRDFLAADRVEGTTNDRTAIAAMFASGARAFYIPAGTYYWLTKGNLDMPEGSILFGEGDQSVIRNEADGYADTTGGAHMIRLRDNCTVRNLRFEGEHDNGGNFHDGGAALRVAGNANTIIDNVTFEAMRGDGVYLEDVVNCQVSNCRIYGARNGIALVDQAAGSDGVRFLFNHCRNFNVAGIDMEADSVGSTSPCNNGLILGCILEGKSSGTNYGGLFFTRSLNNGYLKYNNWLISHLVIRNAFNAVYVIGSKDMTFQHVVIEGSERGFEMGDTPNPNVNIRIEDCVSTTTSFAILFYDGGGGVLSEKLTVERSKFFSGSGSTPAVRLAAIDCVLRDCEFTNTAGAATGIRAFAECDGLLEITRCKFTDYSNVQIQIDANVTARIRIRDLDLISDQLNIAIGILNNSTVTDATIDEVRFTGTHTTQITAGNAIVDGVGSIAFAKLASPADAAAVRASTASRVMETSNIEAASAIVTLTDGATIAVDWDTFINGEVTITDNRTLGLPTNGQPGTWRTIDVVQDGTGTHTLAFAAGYHFPGGSIPTITATAAARSTLNVYCRTSSIFHVFPSLDIKAPA